jgi:hypothetical protein
MASTIPNTLLNLLRGPSLRVRTGLWLLPPEDLDDAPNEAARVGIDTVDLREELLAALPPATQFVALSSRRLLDLLDHVATQPAAGGCTLVYNLDLLLARLTLSQRKEVWEFVSIGFVHRTSALLFVMPDTARSLLPPPAALEDWSQVGRIYPPSH